MRWTEWLFRRAASRATRPVRVSRRPRLLLQTLEERAVPAVLVIDSFTGAQNLSVSTAGPSTAFGVEESGAILGGERDLTVSKLTGVNGPNVQVIETGGSLALNTPLGVTGSIKVVWDGNEGAGVEAPDALGLGANLSGLNFFRVAAQTDLAGVGSQLRITIVDTLGATATQTLNIPILATPLIYNFSGFAGIGALNLASIGRIELETLNVPAAGDIDIALIEADANVDLSLTKTIAPAAGPYTGGDTITYTITVTNNNVDGAIATNVTVRDVIPSQLSSPVFTPSVGSFVINTWTVGTLAAGASATLLITGVLNDTGAVSNYAQVQTMDGTDPDSVPGDNSTTQDDDDTVTITVVAADFGDAPATYGTLLPTGARHSDTGPTLGLTRDNEPDGQPNATATGDGADENGVTVGTLPIGASTNATVVVAGGAGFLNAWVDFNGDGDFDVAEQVTTNVAVAVGSNSVPIVVPAGAVAGTSFARFRLTSASVVGPSPLGLLPSGEVEDYQVTIAVVALPDLELAKVVDNPTPAVGSTVTYTLTLTNVSVTAATGVVVTDVFPAGVSVTGSTPSGGTTFTPGTGIWNVGNLAGGASVTLVVTATVTGAGTITNSAEVTATLPGDSDSTPNNGSTTEDDDASAAITVVTLDFGDAPNTFGTNLASNGARHIATGVFLGTLRDTEVNGLPSAVSNADDVDASDDEDGVTFPIVAGSPLLTRGISNAITVTASGPGFLNAWIDLNANGVFEPGEQVATNQAVVAGANTVNVTIPAGAPLGISHSRFRVTDASVAVPSPLGQAPTGEVEDHAIAFGDQIDLSLDKSVSNATPNVGDNIVFTLDLTNAGPSAATGVSVTDVLPAGLAFVSSTATAGTYSNGTGIWTVGTVGAASTVTLTITVTVTAPGVIINNSEVRTDNEIDIDSSPGNSSTTEDDDDSVTVTATALDFGDAPTAAQSGFAASYPTTLAANGARHRDVGVRLGATRDVENDGQPNAAATGDGADEDGVTGIATLTQGAANTAVFNVQNIAAASVFSVWIDFNADGDWIDAGEQVITDQAVAANGAVNGILNIPLLASVNVNTFARVRIGTQAGLAPTGLAIDGEVEDYAVLLRQIADLSLVKTVNNPTPDLGDNVVFTLTLSNAGPNAATGVTVTDLLPAGASFVSAVPSAGSYSSVTGVWTVGSVASGGTATLAITATVTATGVITNNSEVTASAQFDPDSTPNNASTTEDDDDPETITVSPLDFGDAPTAAQSGFAASYPTTLAANGARHRDIGVRLGATRDTELDGQPNATATGDGADEDGVTGITTLSQGTANTAVFNVQNIAAASVFSVWVDLNADGDWIDAGEQLITDQAVAANGAVNGILNIPLLASVNVNTFARVRIGTQAGLAPTGVAIDGEVEDYAVLLRQVADLSLDKTVNNLTPDIGDSVTFTVTVTNAGPSPATGVAVRDLLPAGLAFTGAVPSQGSYVSGTGIWTVGTLAAAGPGATATLQITATVTAGGTILNQAEVNASAQFDPDSTPNNGSTTEDDDDPETLTVPLTDFGDAPTSLQTGFVGTYPTTIANNGARHRALGAFLGATRDSENDGQPNVGASGDGADEDGVVTGILTIGATQNIAVNSSGAAFVNAWVDFNRDGDWTDPGEQILLNRPVVAGANSLSVIIPATAIVGNTFGRFRVTDASVPIPNVGGLETTGEVEDYLIAVQRQEDFGDAPISYGTLLVNDGARHTAVVAGPTLGATRDIEADGVPNATATGDDTTGIDDEDGVTVPATLLQGVTSAFTVNAPTGGRLDAFFDFNLDGDFIDPGERVTAPGGVLLAAGANTVNVAIPLTATPGAGYARFRVSTAGNQNPTGLAADGEVEDYAVTIGTGPGTFGDRVWLDNDGDGVQDAGEPGIFGVSVTALFAGPDGDFTTLGDNQTFTAITSVTGAYSFVNVPSGLYRVTTATLPVGTAPTFDRDGLGTPNQVTLTLPPNGNITDVDFGYRGTLSLGDRVWFDANGNTLQEAAETGFTGVDLTLTYAGANGIFGDADDFSLTTTTGANGAYSFANLPGGQYRVVVDTLDLPPAPAQTFDRDDAAPTLDNTANITLTVPRTDVDFGYRGRVTVGDRIWNDANNDGLLNGAEVGINGVTVELLNSVGTVVGTTTTATVGALAGVYSFAGQFNGTYSVRLPDTNFLAGGALVAFTNSAPTFNPEDPANNNRDNGAVVGTIGQPGGAVVTGQFILTAGTEPINDGDASTDTNLSIDIGLVSRQSAGNLVFNDLNNNGIRDVGDAGIDGVQVRLMDATGTTQVAVTTTAGGGFYSFPNVPAATYIVEIAAGNFAGPLTNFSSSTGNPGSLTPTPFEGALTPDPDLVPTDNDDNGTTVGAVVRSLPFTLGDGEPLGETEPDPSGTPDNQSNFTVDFGFTQKSRITGTVFVDLNVNGTQDPAETTGVATVIITAVGPNGTFTTTTNAAGAYAFENIPAGTYTVTQTQPAGYGSSTPNVVLVTAPANGTGVVNFGETVGSLSGRIWLNYNNLTDFNGPDTPLVGIVVTLTGTDANALPVNRTATTDASGNYTFAGVVGGTYVLTEGSTTGVGQPPNADGIDFQGPGNAGGTTGNDTFTNIVLPAAVNATGYNFTEIPRTSLSGSVYDDLNSNGVRDIGEPGIATTVTLTGTDVSGALVNTPVVTNANGDYTFPNILPSVNYTVTETQPALFLDGREQNGTPPAAITAVNDQFSGINLTGTALPAVGYNFGEVRAVSIAGNVYIDSDGNGIKAGATELGIGGVTITLSGTDDLGAGVSLTTTTSSVLATLGQYSFPNLRPGTYTVIETQPLAFGDGVDTLGNRGGSAAVNDVFSGIQLFSGQTATGYNFGENGNVDLQITESIDRTSARVGDVVFITYRVRNNGPAQGTGIVASALPASGLAFNNILSLPPGTTYDPSTGQWTIGTLNAGQETTLIVGFRLLRPGLFFNSSSVRGIQTETTLANNNSLSAISVVASQITKQQFLASSRR